MQDELAVFSTSELQNMEDFINSLWIHKENTDSAKIKHTIDIIYNLLNQGILRICSKVEGQWQVHQWLKKALLLSFSIYSNHTVAGGPAESFWFDKLPSKFHGWKEKEFLNAGFRTIPGVFVRKSAFIAKNCILMPSFINIGTYIDQGSMIDSGTTIGSCAQIGKNCHISSNVVIGGVLEPIQNNPVIIEDNCFIGAQTSITEGIIVEEGAVIASGTQLSMSTKIIDRATGKISHGVIPQYAVVVPGSYSVDNGLSINCAIITKQVDSQTRSKTSLNDLLRE